MPVQLKVLSEIQERFGFVPPFFLPAQETPELLESLWQQTLAAYLDNPLPAIFKEKLSAYLSRYCPVPYCLVCHSCTLRPLGMRPQEILALLEMAAPDDLEIAAHLAALAAQPAPLPAFPEPGSELEQHLLACAIHAFLRQPGSERSLAQLQCSLGEAWYNHLLALLGYIKVCHLWVEGHPELAYEADQRAQLHLQPLLREEPALDKFFHSYRERIRHDRESRESQLLAEIAERRRAEAALRESEARFRAFFRDATLGIVLVDTEGIVIESNPALQRMLGYSAEELRGLSAAVVTHPEDLALDRALFGELLDGKRELYHIEKRYVRKDGLLRWGSLTVSLLRTSEQAPPFAMAMVEDITERREVEQALRDSERKLRLIAENISEVIYAYSLDGRLLYVNPTVEQLTGYTVQELYQHNFINWAYAADEPKVRGLWEQLLQGGSFCDEEFRIRTKDGQIKWLLSSWGPFYDEEGRQIGILGHDRDITERKRAEEALRLLAEVSSSFASSLDYETTLSLLARAAVPTFADYCLVDMLAEDGSIQRVTLAAADQGKYELLQELQRRYPPSWDSPHPATRVLHAGRALFMPQMTEESIRRHTVEPGHYELIRALDPRSSIFVPLQARDYTLGVINFVLSESGRSYDARDLALAEELARRAAVALDNARLYRNRQQAEEHARQQAGRLHVLAEASRAFAAASLDLQVVLDTIAHHLVELLGDICIIRLISEDGQWLLPAAIFHNDPQVTSFLFQVLAAEPARIDEGLAGHMLRSGQPIFVPVVDMDQLRQTIKPEYRPHLDRFTVRSLLLVPLAARGRTIGTLGLMRLDSSQPYTQDDLALVQDLADRAALALANASLYAEAQQALQVRDQFLSIAAHELRTPITAIMGYTQLLQRRLERLGQLEPRVDQVLETLAIQVRRLERLNLTLLDLSRIQIGGFTLERGSVDVQQVARQLVAEIQPTLERHELRLHCPEQPIVIEGDELRLEQVLYNLVQNAVKYSPNGGQVEIRVEPQQQLVRLSIADQGIGIPADSLPKLFSRFYRGSNVAARQIHGMGLGLYVVKEIVTLHGGTVEVQSTEGQGSTFTVCLPRHGLAGGEPGVLSSPVN